MSVDGIVVTRGSALRHHRLEGVRRPAQGPRGTRRAATSGRQARQRRLIDPASGGLNARRDHTVRRRPPLSHGDNGKSVCSLSCSSEARPRGGRSAGGRSCSSGAEHEPAQEPGARPDRNAGGRQHERLEGPALTRDGQGSKPADRERGPPPGGELATVTDAYQAMTAQAMRVTTSTGPARKTKIHNPPPAARSTTPRSSAHPPSNGQQGEHQRHDRVGLEQRKEGSPQRPLDRIRALDRPPPEPARDPSVGARLGGKRGRGRPSPHLTPHGRGPTSAAALDGLSAADQRDAERSAESRGAPFAA